MLFLYHFGRAQSGTFEHKIGVFALGKPGIGIGKNKYGRSCKSPRTPLKCKVLITRQLTFEGVLDELKLCLPSTAIKYNYLCIRCLCFEGVRGDLHERRTHQVAALSSTQHLRPWPGDSLIRPRCARLLAKPEYSSPPDEVCCWQGRQW